jgi:tRNA pseudouridine55 synthase
MTDADASFDGVLPIDKPAGPTSHDVVAAARRALRIRRIGHTGTLDPFASGLLLLCVGQATRIAEYVTGLDKRYHARVQLGTTTDTDDCTGTVIEQQDAALITTDRVEAALVQFRGAIRQTPPQYSAKKVAGERAYAAARAGRVVALEPVDVVIRELVLSRFDPPELDLDITCTSGTYIRSIARDLGAVLGVGAHLTALRRVAVGRHRVEDAVTLAEMREDPAHARSRAFAPLDALDDMPRVDLNEDALRHIQHGRAIPGAPGASGPAALVYRDALVAIAHAADGMLRPRKVFA